MPSASILYNPPGTQESLTQTYPTDVFNKSKSAETYQLSVVPVGAVTFDEPSGVIPAGTTYSPVTITPKADSTSVNGTHIYVSYNGSTPQPLLNLTIVSITYGMTPGSVSAHIRNIDTPAGMPDRIPPKVPTNLYVNITPNLANSGQTVTLGVSPQSPVTGTFTINGGNSVVLTGSGVVALKGSTQTAPGFAGRLKLGVFLTGPDFAETGFDSDGFSISAIPINIVEHINAIFQGNAYGFQVSDFYNSDSGSIADLDDISVSEDLDITKTTETGTMTGYLPKTTNGVYNAMLGSDGQEHHNDAHSVAASRLIGPGYAALNQVHLFNDARTGSNGIVVPGSGFQISFSIFDNNGTWAVTTTKKGLKVTANGATSNAGSTTDPGGNPINQIQETQP